MINKENSSISTTYVPLQPPYQIIKYGHQVGMQIGTLIVVKEPVHAAPMGNRNSLRIETHSYPVVTYRNKENVSKEQHLFEHYFMEGVVWDRVELSKVNTICLSNSHLPWEEYIDMLWSDINSRGYKSEPELNLYNKLGEFGVKVDPIPPGNHVVHLETYCGDENPVMVRSSRNDIIALNVLLTGEDQQMANELSMQIMKYNLAFNLPSGKKPSGKWHLKFTTDEDMLKPLVELLNHPKEKLMVGNIPVNSVQPYEDEV